MGTMPSVRIRLLTLILLLTTVGVASAQGPVRLETSAETISLDSVEGGMSIMKWLEAIGEAFDIDVVVDPRMRDFQVELSLQDLGPEEALDRACTAAGLMWVALDERSVVVAEDNPQMRRRYEPIVVQTFYLENAELRDAMTMLRSMIGVRNVSAVESLHALTVRDTAPRVALARRLIERHDHAPAILEVDVRLVQASAGAIENAFGGTALPARLGADQAARLEAEGRLLARPTLSFADGRQAAIEIGRSAGADERPAFSLALSGRVVGSGPRVSLDLRVEGDSVAESAPVPERRSQTSSVRLEPGETWLVAGLLQAAGEDPAEPDQLVLLLTPRVASASTVRAADREPLAVGTESHLGLDEDD